MLATANAPARDAAVESQLGVIACTGAHNAVALSHIAFAATMMAGGMAKTPAEEAAIKSSLGYYVEQGPKLQAEAATRTEKMAELEEAAEKAKAVAAKKVAVVLDLTADSGSDDEYTFMTTPSVAAAHAPGTGGGSGSVAGQTCVRLSLKPYTLHPQP